MSTGVSTEVATSTWKIDPAHSAAQFEVRHMMISNVKGEFTHVSGKLELDGADITKPPNSSYYDCGVGVPVLAFRQSLISSCP